MNKTEKVWSLVLLSCCIMAFIALKLLKIIIRVVLMIIYNIEYSRAVVAFRHILLFKTETILIVLLFIVICFYFQNILRNFYNAIYSYYLVNKKKIKETIITIIALIALLLIILFFIIMLFYFSK